MNEHKHKWAVWGHVANGILYKCVDCATTCSATERMEAAEAALERVRGWIEFIRYNSKDAAHMADEHVDELAAALKGEGK